MEEWELLMKRASAEGKGFGGGEERMGDWELLIADF
jgi:hypothetical protein